MRLRQIEVFYHVYKEGSISGAARSLYVSQPSVSKVLRHAEDQLGFPLFVRRKGRLYPTEAANELFREVSDIYDRVGALDRRADNIRNRKGGHIRIGVLPSLGFAIAPTLVAEMRKENPEVTFDIATLHSEELTSALLEKRFDLCIAFDDDFDARLRCSTINAVSLSLLAPPGVFPEGETSLSPDVLDGREMIGLRDSGPVADKIYAYLDNAGVEPRVSVSVQTYFIAAELAKLGAGLAIVDGFTAKRVAGDQLRAFSLEGAPSLPFAAITLADDEENVLIQSCVRRLSQLFC